MVIVVVLIVLLALYLYLIMPQKPDYETRSKFVGRNYAHRGLHTKDKYIPENSLAAIKQAVSAGYGIEFDVHVTLDDKLIVFHDNSVSRMCGVEGIVEEMTLDEIGELRLAGTGEKIPTFDQVLEVVGGKVPLIIELKSGKTGKDMLLCQLVAQRLESYDGVYCIESFDPRIVAWFRRNRSHIVRGQLLMQRSGYKSEVANIAAFALSNALINVLVRPHFIAHRKGKKSFSVRLAERLGAMRFVWTIHLEDEPEKLYPVYDGLIFEFYRPDVKF